MENKRITRITIYAAVVMIVIVVAGLIYKLTNGFTEEVKSFYAEVNGKEIINEIKGVMISEDEPLGVKIRYTTTKADEYTVKILPNANFTYVANGEEKNFKDIPDLTDGFIISKDKKSFTVKPRGGVTETLKAALKQDISDCDDLATNDMYLLVITSGESEVKIYFAVKSAATGVKFNEEVIRF